MPRVVNHYDLHHFPLRHFDPEHCFNRRPFNLMSAASVCGTMLNNVYAFLLVDLIQVQGRGLLYVVGCGESGQVVWIDQG